MSEQDTADMTSMVEKISKHFGQSQVVVLVARDNGTRLTFGTNTEYPAAAMIMDRVASRIREATPKKEAG